MSAEGKGTFGHALPTVIRAGNHEGLPFSLLGEMSAASGNESAGAMRAAGGHASVDHSGGCDWHVVRFGTQQEDSVNCSQCHRRLMPGDYFCGQCGGRGEVASSGEFFALVDFMRGVEVCVVARRCLEQLEARVPQLCNRTTEGTLYFAGTVTPHLVASVPGGFPDVKHALRRHLDRWYPFGFIAGPIAESPGVRSMVWSAS